MKTNLRFFELLPTVLAFVASIMPQWACKNKIVTSPFQLSRNEFLFLTCQTITTQTVLESGVGYTPAHLEYCGNRTVPRNFVGTGDCPTCWLCSGPFSFYPDEHLLEFYSFDDPSNLDSSTNVLYWW